MPIRDWIANQFGWILMVGLGAGLFVPGTEYLPGELVKIFLAVIIYFAISKIEVQDVKAVKIVPVLSVYVLRFLCLPIVVFFIAQHLLPDYSYALFMLLLLPTGATLTAVTAIMGGNPVLGLGMTVMTNLLVPFILPLAFTIFVGTSIEVDTLAMFNTICFVVFAPILLYGVTMKVLPKALQLIKINASSASAILISIVAMTIVANERDVILSDLMFLLEAVLIGVSVYVSLYMLGWFGTWWASLRERISYALICGNNNIALGIAIAFVALPSRETVALVMWELAWISGLSFFQLFLSWRKKA